MAKNKRQWGRFRLENRIIWKQKFYDLQINVAIFPETNKWKTIETYDYFGNARYRAREMDKIMDGVRTCK